MRLIILITFIVLCNICGSLETPTSLKDSYIDNLIATYRNQTYGFIVPIYKAVSDYSNVNFVFSPRSIWLMLAAIAEGSNEETKQKLFKILHLSDEPYYRYKFYELMTSRVGTVNAANLVESRTLLLDESLNINPTWLNLVSISSLLDVVTVPMRNNPEYTRNWIKRITNTNDPRIDLSGNAVLFDTIDYNGIWATAFNDAIIENSPFYSQVGEEIGSIQLMRIKRRARIGYIKSLNSRILELPVGDENYRMVFVTGLVKEDVKSIVKRINNNIIFEMFDSLNDTVVPIDIAIPRIKIISEIDVKEILKDYGISDLWRNPDATKYISSPPAFPKSYVQRASLTLDKFGIAATPEDTNPSVENNSSLKPEDTMDFIVNKPFMCGLFDVETHTPLIAMAMSQPTVYKFGTTYIHHL